VKSEFADHFDSFGEAKMALFDYIEAFYTQRRRHSTLGQISPAAFERRTSVAKVTRWGARLLTTMGTPPSACPLSSINVKQDPQNRQTED
jgi:truncated hemoglobin YjbI